MSLRGIHDLCDICDMSTDAAAHRWVPDTSTFGARLALIRQKKGWNLKEAALACGLPSGSWREWELKNRDPRSMQHIVEQIADHTGCDDYWLMTGKDTPGGRPHHPGGGLPKPRQPRSLLPRLDSNQEPADCMLVGAWPAFPLEWAA